MDEGLVVAHGWTGHAAETVETSEVVRLKPPSSSNA